MSHEYPVPPWEEEGGVKVVMVWDTAAIVVCTLWPLFAEAATRPAARKSRRVAGGNYGGSRQNRISSGDEGQEKEKEKKIKRRRTGARFRVEWEDPGARDEIPERWGDGPVVLLSWVSGRGRGFADLVLSLLLDSSQPPGWGSAQNKRGTALSTVACVSRTAGDSMDLCNVWA